MLKLGVIGTSWITAQFITAAHRTGMYRLTAVYSRHAETAQHFIAESAPAQAYTDMEAFLGSDIDVVYVASPNSLHAAQTIAALSAGKHVIVEKPMVTHPSQLAKLEEALAAHPDLMVFEAARHIYDPNFHAVTDYIAHHPVTGATLAYMKYSSKYDDYLAGKQPNIFTTKPAGGALMDLGVYLVYAAVGWFGGPTTATYQPHMLASGVDGDGVMRFDYPDFGVTLVTGKTTNHFAPSEIYFGRTTLQTDTPGELNYLKLISAGQRTDITAAQHDNPMVSEARFFAEAITKNDRAAFDRQWALAKQVHTLMGQMRAATPIHFDSDPD